MLLLAAVSHAVTEALKLIHCALGGRTLPAAGSVVSISRVTDFDSSPRGQTAALSTLVNRISHLHSIADAAVADVSPVYS